MASVYAATHRNGSRFALKILHDHVSRDPDVRRLFRREALAANRIDHPGAVRVLDDDVAEDGCAFLVMPLLSGETLQARWERSGKRLPVRDALIVAHAILDTLAAAHAKGIVHRDIKPDNLFITSDGDVRILDFGVARLLEQSDTAVATRAGHAIGTPAFMPPEQALGRVGEIDGQSDLWAVGATLFTSLSGHYVHGSHTASELLVYAATRPAPSLISVLTCESALGALVDRALAFAKHDRWANADAMNVALVSLFEALLSEPMPKPARISPPPVDATAPTWDSTRRVDNHSDVTRAPLAHGAVTPIARDRGPRSRVIAIVFASLVALASVLAIRRTSLPTTAQSPSDAGAESKAETEATAAYQSWRDGATALSMSHIAKAISEDGTIARAHLLRAIEGFWSDSVSQASFQKAWEYRAQLTERDTALLFAYQPAVATTSDPMAASVALLAAYKKYPDYELAAYCLSAMYLRLGKIDDARTTMESFLARHEAFAAGWYVIGEAHVWAGDVDGASLAYHKCLKISPPATDCLSDLALLDENEGNCVEAEALSRTWLTADPDSSQCCRSLARAIFGRGGSLDSARAILGQGLLISKPSRRPFLQAKRDLALGVLEGDFRTAREQVTAAETALAGENDEADHEEIALAGMRIELELGNATGVARIADAYSERRDAWTKSDFIDYGIVPLRAKYLAGLTSRRAFVGQRDEWLKVQEGRQEQVGVRGFEWSMAFAEAVATDADAVEALDVLPRFLPLVDPMTRDADMDVLIGHVYLLAGQLPDARRFLERATRSCRALDLPLSQTVAWLYLGELLEKNGDVNGACKAYRVVLSRWGKVRESHSAATARERASKLACPLEYNSATR
jgi:serine/threonine protein kinase